jgi:hypothetical protein
MINPNKRMMVAPPMAQVVHTMLAQALFVPPSLSASSREKVPAWSTSRDMSGPHGLIVIGPLDLTDPSLRDTSAARASFD